MHSYIRNNLYLETRSLALLRIALGLIVTGNVLWFMSHVDFAFGPHGLLPLGAVKDTLPWSFFSLNDSRAYTLSLLCLHLLAGLMLLAGWRTRAATIICWLLQLSLEHRMPLLDVKADMALHLFLFWGMFLPLGRHFSVDSIKKPAAPAKVADAAVMAFILQLGLIYLIAAASKTHPSWGQERTALYYTLNLFEFARPFGQWLTQFPGLLKALTMLTLALESIGIALLFIPRYQHMCRLLTIAAFTLFHITIYLSMDVGYLSWVMLAAWAALLPTEVWGAPPAGTVPPLPNAVRILVALVFIYCLAMGSYQAQKGPLRDVLAQDQNLRAADALGLTQRWRMFAYSPPVARKYYYAPVLADGQVTPMAFDEQHNFRFKKFLALLGERYDPRCPGLLKQYAAHQWAKGHPDKPARAVEIIYAEYAVIPGQPLGEPRWHVL